MKKSLASDVRFHIDPRASALSSRFVPFETQEYKRGPLKIGPRPIVVKGSGFKKIGQFIKNPFK